jgi:hypothetical protein
MTNTMNDTDRPTITEGNLRDIRAMLPYGGSRKGLMTVCLNYFDDPENGIEKAILAFNALLPDNN